MHHERHAASYIFLYRYAATNPACRVSSRPALAKQSSSSPWIDYHSPQSSSFFPPAGFLTAAVPRLAVFFCACSPAAAKLSQKSFFSAAGPCGGAPKLSQKSRFSVAGPPARVLPSPSTNRFRPTAACRVPSCSVWPSWPAVCWAWRAKSDSWN